MTFRPRPGLFAQLSYELNDVSLAQGDFATKLYRADVRAQFSPWVSLANNIQYDTVSQLLGWQMRFRWIVRPGNDFFLVYTHNWSDSLDNRFRSIDNRAVTKAVYTLRF
jgi:hypothetical protein